MIWFYRDFLDGFVYLAVAFLSLIFIMAIIGFICERKKFEEEEKNRLAVLSGEMPVDISVVSSPEVVAEEENTTAVSQSVIPQDVIEKSQNAATNIKIPEVLDLNEIEEKQQEVIDSSTQN